MPQHHREGDGVLSRQPLILGKSVDRLSVVREDQNAAIARETTDDGVDKSGALSDQILRFVHNELSKFSEPLLDFLAAGFDYLARLLYGMRVSTSK
jgi:hypothetical protein